MTVQDLKNLNFTSVEVYRRQNENSKSLLLDNLEAVDSDNVNIVVEDYIILDSAQAYNNTLLANASVDAEEWWEDGSAVLVVVVQWDYYNNIPIVEE